MVEELILQALRSPDIAGKLSTFQGLPAVFYQYAPDDTARGWPQVQYPRLDFTVDWQSDPERSAAGLLQINVWCLERQTPPEEIGADIRGRLKDLFLTGQETYALAWGRTDPFEAGDENPRVVGVSMQFDLLAFPLAKGGPAESLSRYIKARVPVCQVIGLDNLPGLCRPTENSPIVYVRHGSTVTPRRQSYAAAWMQESVPVHVFAPGMSNRVRLCRELTQRLVMDGEILLQDGGPFLIQQIEQRTGADPLSQGQLTIRGEYGVLRPPEQSATLRHANLSFEVNYETK